MRAADPTILRGAAAILRDHGWMQGDYGVSGGPRCLSGALHEAKGLGENVTVSVEAALLNDILGLPHGMDLTDWNDDSERRLDEVILALEQAAEKVEAEL